MHSQPRVSRQVELVSHPNGRLQSSDFAVTERPLPPLGPGQALLRNRWFRVSVSTRLMASRDATAIKGIPFPPLKPGDPLSDGAIGEVVATTSESALHVGDVVLHSKGWRDYAVKTGVRVHFFLSRPCVRYVNDRYWWNDALSLWKGRYKKVHSDPGFELHLLLPDFATVSDQDSDK